MRTKTGESKLRRSVPYIAPLAAFMVAGCGGTGLLGSGPPAAATKTPKCFEITIDGNKVRPHEYPLGVVAVYYADLQSVEGPEVDNETQGVISAGSGGNGYELLVRDENFVDNFRRNPNNDPQPLQAFDGLASKLANRIVVGISSPQTGELGLTSGCVSLRTVNNLPTAVVQLPSSESGN
jgi:hypothetical protein